MSENRVALISGANKGIGQQIAKDLAAQGITVLIGSRKLESGEIAAKAIGEKAHAIQLDVTDADSVAAAAERIRKEFGRLDILVNNAGTVGEFPPGTPFAERLKFNTPSVAPLEYIRQVFDTNVFGVISLTQAVLPLLREAPAGRIVNVGSSMGSLKLASDPANPYRPIFGAAYSPSKTALNAVTMAFSIELEKTNIKVNVVCPGYVATDLNDHQGHRTVEQGAKQAVKMALIGPEGPTGTYSDEDGTIAW
ncbi:SDR family oxidoreductase [Granulicella paludicola]|uniref:SDR family oxidoreductase n=1 Tax=Granulicella paludicola TaxID=474951 RepID=UPI0021DFAD26|nr:SDR family oxidoreductase [Granulicella paludicola]